MRIERIQFEALTVYESAALELPSRGVVLVTGDNGSGKSTLIEAVPWTLWGKSLRGSSLWNGKGGSVRITIDGETYERTERGRVKAGWIGGPSFETTREAQAALVERFGSRDDWTKSAVLSSYDASRFATATDAERKRLLEGITGSDILERGYRASLEELRELRRELELHEAATDTARAALEGAKKRVADLVTLTGAGAPDTPEPVDDKRLHALRGADRASRDEIDQRRSDIMEARERDARAAQRSETAKRDRDRLAGEDCPTCGQKITAEKRVELEALASSIEEETREEEERVRAEISGIRADLASLEEERAEIRAEIASIEAAQVKAAALAREADRFEKAGELKREALEDLAAASTALEEAREKVDSASRQARTIEAASRVLSTKGVRAHLLGRTIAAIEAATNSWLGRICGERISVALAPYSETKTGAVKDSVSLSVQIDGRSGPYESASGGERRRVDVALCFALSQVAEASRPGSERSTLFCDEVFDALDVDGVSRVCAALEEIARDRCVVVISHSAAGKLREIACAAYHVEGGRISKC